MTDLPSSPRRSLGIALWRLADLVRVDEGRRSFRSKAYREAVWALDSLSPDLSEDAATVRTIPGIGEGVARLIDEHRDSGRLRMLDRLEEAYPAESPRLARLPGATPARLRRLKEELGVETGGDLLAAIDTGAIASVPGVGPATAQTWQRYLESLPPPPGHPIFRAAGLAARHARHLERHLPGVEVLVSGSVRRYAEWVTDLDLVAAGGEPDTAAAFLSGSALTAEVLDRTGSRTTVRVVAGLDLRLHTVAPEEAGTALLATTGPPEHVLAVLARIPDSSQTSTEADVYAAAGLEVVPPPARTADLERVRDPLTPPDLRGDLHLHTDRSPDGRMTLEDLLVEARHLGYAYLAVTDHGHHLRFGGLTPERLLAQRRLVDRVSGAGIVVFQGCELNIGTDGGLDFDDETLSLLDVGVAGVHSAFGLDRDTQTRRVLAAIAHPAVDVIAHPTGRRIGIRPGIDLDLEAVVAAAVEHGVALEVNGHLDRLDLGADAARLAGEAGALFAADSDAHRVDEMGNVEHAVAVLQKAGIGADRVVNTWPLDRFEKWLRRRRG